MVREERELERELHKQAMVVYWEEIGRQPAEKEKINRNQVRAIKKKMTNDNLKFETLRGKFGGTEATEDDEVFHQGMHAVGSS